MRYPTAKESMEISTTPRARIVAISWRLTYAMNLDSITILFMATTKSSGTAKNMRDSAPKYLGVKLFAGEKAKAGQILVRQRGTHFVAGKNVGMGNDHTLFALKEGSVQFLSKRKTGFDRSRREIKVVNIISPSS